MPGSSMLRTQQVTARESGMAGMAWCSGPCSSPVAGPVAAAADDCDGMVSILGGSLIWTVRALAVDDVRPTAECSLGSERRVPSPGPAVDELGSAWLSTATRLAVTSAAAAAADVICSNQPRDRCDEILHAADSSRTRRRKRIIKTDVRLYTVYHKKGSPTFLTVTQVCFAGF